MKSFFILGLLFFSVTASFPYAQEKELAKEKSTIDAEEEQALFLRRLSEFWEEGEIALVKTEIELFLRQNPQQEKNRFFNYLLSFLGDIHVQEKNFQEALSCYQKLDLAEFTDKTIYNQLQCLYEMGQFDNVVTLIGEKLKDANLKNQEKEDLAYIFADSLYQQAKKAENEQKDKLAKEAKKAFEILLEGEYQKEAIAALKELNFWLKDYQAPAELYLSLALKYPEKKEEFLFQAGIYMAEIDKTRAYKIFAELWTDQGKMALDALYNKMLILFEEEKYREAAEDCLTLFQNFNKENSFFLNFFLGRSLYKLGEDQKSKEYYLAFTSKDTTHMPELKIALNDLMSIADETKDPELFNEAFTKFSTLFPNDDLLVENRMQKALFYAKIGEAQTAEAEFEKIERDCEKISESETFLFEYAKLYYQTEKWEASRARFKKFLEKYPESSFADAAWRYYINSSINNLASTSPEDSTIDKQYLSHALEKFLTHAKPNEIERADYLYLLGQVKFSLKDYDEAILDLKMASQEFPNHPNLTDIYLLLAFSYKNQYRDSKNFDFYVTLAQQTDPKFTKNPNTQLAIFNGYTDFALSQPQDDHLLKSAAQHLFTAYKLKANIKPANLFWLSDHFKKQAVSQQEKKDKNSLFKKAAALKNNALKQIIKTNPKDPLIEEEILKLTEIYALQGKYEKMQKWLALLSNFYLSHPKNEWRYKGYTAFYLANCLENLKDYKNAQLNYHRAIELMPKTADMFPEALLKTTRIDLFLLDANKRLSESPEIMKSLENLQSLVLQKNLKSEPSHLEAALEYVDLQCYLEKEKKEEKRLFLLNKMKDLFSKEDDIPSKDYHAQRKTSLFKNQLFLAYMQLIEIEMLMSKAIMEKEKDPKKCAEYKTQIQILANEFEDKDLPATDFLQKRLKRKMKMLEAF